MKSKKLWIVLGIIGGVMLLSCPICIVIGIPAIQKVILAAHHMKRQAELNDLGKAIHQFHEDNKGRMPSKAEDLSPYVDNMILDHVRNNKIEVIWDAVSLRNLGKHRLGPSSTIMAWDNEFAGKGVRMVLFADTNTEKLTEEQFHTVPKMPFK